MLTGRSCAVRAATRLANASSSHPSVLPFRSGIAWTRLRHSSPRISLRNWHRRVTRQSRQFGHTSSKRARLVTDISAEAASVRRPHFSVEMVNCGPFAPSCALGPSGACPRTPISFIGTFRPFANVRVMSAGEGNPDIQGQLHKPNEYALRHRKG